MNTLLILIATGLLAVVLAAPFAAGDAPSASPCCEGSDCRPGCCEACPPDCCEACPENCQPTCDDCNGSACCGQGGT